jgi:arylsulfatase
VYIDGVNNLAHWTGDAPSQRNFEIYYNESEMTAVRIGNWKSHIKTREGFFDFNEPSALIVNLRQDPFERQTGWKSREMAMRLGIAWGGQIQDLLADHMKSLAMFPPRQKGGSLTIQPDK